jgi:hypothetical protein
MSAVMTRLVILVQWDSMSAQGLVALARTIVASARMKTLVVCVCLGSSMTKGLARLALIIACFALMLLLAFTAI